MIEGDWVRGNLEDAAVSLGVTLARGHLEEVRRRTLDRVDRVAEAVRSRLESEIRHWDHRAADLRERELAGRLPASGMNSANARQRADDLKVRLRNRLTELDAERQLSSAPPVVVGGALVIPAGLLSQLRSRTGTYPARTTRLAAIQTVVAAERALGRTPVEVPPGGQGYDIESRAPDGTPLFITVKHKLPGADSFPVNQSEIGVARNTGHRHVLALVDGHQVRYLRASFTAVADPPFGLSGISLPWRSNFEHGRVPQ